MKLLEQGLLLLLLLLCMLLMLEMGVLVFVRSRTQTLHIGRNHIEDSCIVVVVSSIPHHPQPFQTVAGYLAPSMAKDLA